jgi:hypothetical protein
MPLERERLRQHSRQSLVYTVGRGYRIMDCMRWMSGWMHSIGRLLCVDDVCSTRGDKLSVIRGGVDATRRLIEKVGCP